MTAVAKCLEGNALLQSGDYAKAKISYEEAIGINEGTRQLNIARCYQKLGMWNSSEEILQQLLSSKMNNVVDEYTKVMSWCLLCVVEKQTKPEIPTQKYPGTALLDADLFSVTSQSDVVDIISGNNDDIRLTSKKLLNSGNLLHGVDTLYQIPPSKRTASDFFHLLKALQDLGRNTEVINLSIEALSLFPSNKELVAYVANRHLSSRYQSSHFRECIRIGTTKEYHNSDTSAVVNLKNCPTSSESVVLISYSFLYLGNFQKSLEVLLEDKSNKSLSAAVIVKSIWNVADKPLKDIKLFADISPEVKEAIAKKGSSSEISVDDLLLNSTNEDTSKIRMSSQLHSEFRKAAATLGESLQYNGLAAFVKNKRQHIASGMAILVFQNLFEGDSDECDWNLFFQPAIVWRQLSDVSNLVEFSSSLTTTSYKSGLGNQTPIQIGDFLVPKYAAYRDRCLDLLKDHLPRQYIMTDEQIEQLETVGNIKTLYQVFGFNIQVITRLSDQKSCLAEGTRIVVSSSDGGKTVVLAIRTASTPRRTSCYTKLLRKYVRKWKSSGTLKSALQCYYYFANFQPLTRGSAACSLTTLQGMVYTNRRQVISLPDGIQLDWEAILNPSFNSFISDVMMWLPHQLYSPSVVEIDTRQLDDITVRDVFKILLYED